MYSKNDSGKIRRRRQTLAFMLTLALTIILTIPSFAENQTGEAGSVNSEENVQTENTEGETFVEEDGQVTENAGETDKESIRPEEDVTEIEPEEDTVKEDPAIPAGSADEAASGGEPKASKEGESKAGKSVEIKKQAQKAKLTKAASDSGKEVRYEGDKFGSAAGETTVFKVTTDGKTYTGTCAKQGVSMKSPGTAEITKISNSKKIAKVIYHYAFELGDENWWTGEGKTDKVGKLLGMNNDNDTNVTKRRLVEAFCQIYHMGSSDWYNTITNAATGGWDERTADRVRDFYTGISDKNWYNYLTVPDGFEIWLADPGNSQPFMIWAYNPTGCVTLKKISADTSITG
ncbi:MAG: hypothetical protein IJJ06_12560 [Mogibacterium sp.]|nr:hypothetical protein [Mogibacterium sp.]